MVVGGEGSKKSCHGCGDVSVSHHVSLHLSGEGVHRGSFVGKTARVLRPQWLSCLGPCSRALILVTYADTALELEGCAFALGVAVAGDR